MNSFNRDYLLMPTPTRTYTPYTHYCSAERPEAQDAHRLLRQVSRVEWSAAWVGDDESIAVALCVWSSHGHLSISPGPLIASDGLIHSFIYSSSVHMHPTPPHHHAAT